MENSTNALRLVKMKAITTNEIGYFHGWGIHGGETVAIIELPNRVVYAKPKDFEFVDEIHARLVSQNKYNHMEAHDEKLQNADGADAESDSDGGMLKDVNEFIERYGGRRINYNTDPRADN